jgi:hypothetical protein
MNLKNILYSILIAGLVLGAPTAFGEEADNGPIETIAFSGGVEVEAGYEKTDPAAAGDSGEESSDLALATVELGVDATVASQVSGHILFLYEDGEDLLIDEGYIVLHGEEAFPLYLMAGEIYVPFGNFESGMISDPLTLELAETRETAIQVGFEAGGFHGDVYLFNGDMDKTEDESHFDNFGLSAGYAYESDAFSIDMGISWINNMADTDGLTDAFEETRTALEEAGFSYDMADYAAGFGTCFILGVGPATLVGEYVGMTEAPEFLLSNLSDDSSAGVDTWEKFSAWNIELDYGVNVGGRDASLSVGYQGSDATADLLPETRILGAFSIGLFEKTSLAFEYLHDEYESGNKTHAVTTQLAMEY